MFYFIISWNTNHCPVHEHNYTRLWLRTRISTPKWAVSTNSDRSTSTPKWAASTDSLYTCMSNPTLECVRRLNNWSVNMTNQLVRVCLNAATTPAGSRWGDLDVAAQVAPMHHHNIATIAIPPVASACNQMQHDSRWHQGGHQHMEANIWESGAKPS